MVIELARQRSMGEARSRILDVALEVLAKNPDAGMGDIAVAAGVVRRTVYGHFPSRIDLVRSLAQLAVDEVQEVLDGAKATGKTAPQVWADFISRVWPLAHRYRVLVVLRRSEYGREIHALLKPVDDSITELVRQGQAAGSFGRHLPADVLGQIAYAAVFNIFDSGSADGSFSAREATITSLLTLGVPASTASELAKSR
jgi:AcrR family transcriptional regulator